MDGAPVLWPNQSNSLWWASSTATHATQSPTQSQPAQIKALSTQTWPPRHSANSAAIDPPYKSNAPKTTSTLVFNHWKTFTTFGPASVRIWSVHHLNLKLPKMMMVASWSCAGRRCKKWVLRSAAVTIRSVACVGLTTKKNCCWKPWR